MNPHRLGLVAATLLAAAGCQDVTFIEPTTPTDPLEDLEAPCITVTPTELDFGDIDLTVEQNIPPQRVVISNECAGDLEIEDVVLNDAPGSAAFSIEGLTNVLVRQGGSEEFQVFFEPLVAGDFSDARVLIETNDPEKPVERVKLLGKGIAPAIEVSPQNYDYGQPFIGCESEQPFQVANVGTADLLLDDVQVFTPASDQFSIDDGGLGRDGLTLAPGSDPHEVWLEYLPLDTIADTANVVFFSNDPSKPQFPILAKGSGTEFGAFTDTFEQPLKGETDILFTFDRSCSMNDEVDKVADNIDTFVETLGGLDADFHAALVVGEPGCPAGPDPYIDRTFDAADAVNVFRTMIDWDRRYIPYASSYEEHGFSQVTAALSANNIGSGGCNEDFYRRNAFLSVVHVSDEPEQSDRVRGITWSDYIALLQSLKRDPDDVKINAVASDYPSGCGSNQAGLGYYEATLATGGLFLSICATDWAGKLEELAVGSVSINDSFELTRKPVPQTIELSIDGVATNVGWEYEVSTNSVVFDTDFIPPGGSTVEIFYQLLPDCEG